MPPPAVGCLFPLSLGAEGTATIGGVLSTNAGGNTTVRYGNARDLMLGLEVVLPDGQVWNGLRRLRKDNTGYALRHLFVGAEGTLGFITAAVLRLFPRPRESEVGFCAVRDEDAALALFRRFRDRDEGAVRAFEYMSGEGVGFYARHIEGGTVPLPGHAHYVLVDLASSRPDAGLRALLEAVLEEAMEAGEVLDATIGESEAQRAALWRIREEHPEAQKREGACGEERRLRPRLEDPELIRRSSEACRRLIPGIRPVPFGHLGDGNIHMNLEQPVGMDPAAIPRPQPRHHGHGERGGPRPRRQLLGRARHRPAEDRHDGGLARRGGAGPDAADQGGGGPAGPDEPGQGAALAPPPPPARPPGFCPGHADGRVATSAMSP